jgi:hypothetical protein
MKRNFLANSHRVLLSALFLLAEMTQQWIVPALWLRSLYGGSKVAHHHLKLAPFVQRPFSLFTISKPVIAAIRIHAQLRSG